MKKTKDAVSCFSLNKFIRGLVDVKLLVKETMSNVEKKADHIVEKVAKALATVIITLTGLVFVLIGLAQFFEAKTGFTTGSGYLTVGIALFVIAILARMLSE